MYACLLVKYACVHVRARVYVLCVYYVCMYVRMHTSPDSLALGRKDKYAQHSQLVVSISESCLAKSVTQKANHYEEGPTQS